MTDCEMEKPKERSAKRTEESKIFSQRAHGAMAKNKGKKKLERQMMKTKHTWTGNN